MRKYSTSIPTILLAAGLLGVAAPVSADNILDEPAAAQVVELVRSWRDDTTQFLVEIGSIESPSGEEHARAARVADEMRRIGLSDVRITDSPNVIGRIPGKSGEATVFVSTLDDLRTVAAHQRARGGPPTVEGNRVVGPGTNTSSTTAAMLTAARALIAAGVEPEHDLVFAGVAQEETGLVGMRDLYDEYRETAREFIDVLGDGRRISYGALGIHWWKVIATGPPGHTLRGGLPNVNLGIARAVDRILGLPQPTEFADRTTRINIAMLQSGTVFNHKPPEGWFSLDIRSLDADIIASIEADVQGILDTVSAETEIAFRLEPENLVPGGQIDGALESDFVRWAGHVSERLGFEPAFSNTGSANLNIAIAAGTPAIGLGGSRGGERGYPGEWADIDAMMRSAAYVALLAIALGSETPAP
jgi:acetylornithine deacetylase/succinyl-diaminopimelate desuccinylase-like protein